MVLAKLTQFLMNSAIPPVLDLLCGELPGQGGDRTVESKLFTGQKRLKKVYICLYKLKGESPLLDQWVSGANVRFFLFKEEEEEEPELVS